jgi:glycerophosphoryl diester phosphodiesterase
MRVFKRILAVSAITLVTLTGATPAIAKPKVPKIPVSVGTELEAIAHATGKGDAPENTIQGIDKAASKGATWVEIDIRWNKSNMPIAMHNAEVDPTTDGTGLLNSYWLAPINDLDAADYDQWDDKNANGTWVYPQYHGTYVGDGGDVKAKVHPPYGWEFFNAATVDNISMLMDIKETPTAIQAQNLYNYIISFNYLSKVIYQGSAASIAAMRGFGYTDLTYYMIENLSAGTMRTGESLIAMGVSGYTVNWPNITPAFVTYYHSYDLKVFTWTTNNAADDVLAKWNVLKAADVDAIITDQHDDLRASL